MSHYIAQFCKCGERPVKIREYNRSEKTMRSTTYWTCTKVPIKDSASVANCSEAAQPPRYPHFRSRAAYDGKVYDYADEPEPEPERVWDGDDSVWPVIDDEPDDVERRGIF